MHQLLSRRSWVAASAAVVLSALAGSGEALAQRKLSFGYDQPKTTGYGVAGQIFEDKMKELSGGKLQIEQYPGAQLGQEPVMLQKLRGGDIDFIITSAANAATIQPEAGVFSLHFIFRDADHLRKALADPRVKEAYATLFSSVQGLRMLGLETLGLRSMYAKREFKTVDDLKGVKVRVQATKTEDTHFPAYGAQTVHMPFGEVYTALQTGVVDAAENGINVYLANKHYEVAPVLSITEHEANNGFIWVSEKTWNSFSDDEKKWAQAAADEVARVQPDRSIKLDSESVGRLEKLGVKVVKDVDKSGFIKIATPVQDQLAKELGPNAMKVLELVRGIQ